MTPFALPVVQRRALAAVAVAVVAGLVLLRHAGSNAPGAGAPVRVAPIVPRPSGATAASSAAPIVVDVVGAVRRPGVYRLPRHARVEDAVARAGGLTRAAQRTAVNLAAPLADGEQVLVAGRGVAGVAASEAGAVGPSAPVSLSTATAEELDALPGIGPVTAQKIVAFREEHGPFTSVEALDAIPGIGPARIADLKGLVVP
jgi:competence protein ComEA